MHPTLALSVVLLSWCFFRNRSMGARALLGVVLALLGWEPATAGNRVGLVLILITAGAAASMAWDLAADALADRRALAAAAAAEAGDAGMVAAPQRSRSAGRTRRARAQRQRQGRGRVRRTPKPSPRPTVPPPPGAVRADFPSPPAPETATSTPERWTELERADAFGDLLEANLAGLADAYRSGDVRAQAAFAGEIADVARGMERTLRVVVGERFRVHGPDFPGTAIPMPPVPPEADG